MARASIHPGLFFCLLSLAFFCLPAHAQEPFRDCPDCPEMVIVPKGGFIMGSDVGHENERPAHPVKIAKPFALGRYEVTFDEWQACFDAQACLRNPDDHKWGRANRPVMNVTIDDVKQFLAWLSQKSGKRYRLPGEAEWEWAARAGTAGLFSWGDKMEPGRANCRGCGDDPFNGFSTAPVGSYPPNAFGLYDMAGNVWEWTEDCWHPDHTGAPKDQKPRGPEANPLPGLPACMARVMKGGAWYYYAQMSRPSARARNEGRVLSYVLGFRVARDVD
ncbi:MAG: formylglycine-generating enzyme family protein [Alphaproteobacteria bacterium]|nr:formylglycine-generating enzyme family protein [Alphaproteobacteria bacterium]